MCLYALVAFFWSDEYPVIGVFDNSLSRARRELLSPDLDAEGAWILHSDFFQFTLQSRTSLILESVHFCHHLRIFDLLSFDRYCSLGILGESLAFNQILQILLHVCAVARMPFEDDFAAFIENHDVRNAMYSVFIAA